MIESDLALAFSMHSKKGIYALLLGSGISRAAGIPTGWEITLDLIAQLAQARSVEVESSEDELCAWYRSEYGAEPDYCQIVGGLAKSETERRQLLNRYFEPTEDEREQGLKQPTSAHRNIAELVAKGYVRIILTTNFDRLMEQALKDSGVQPTVIASPAQVQGAVPLAHQTCVIIKLHGDYLDTELKNTPDEVAEYDAPMNTLLGQVLDEYGLVISGWSAQYDAALRTAIQRCASHRFTTYWTAKDGVLTDEAQSLVRLRRAELIHVSDADSFFTELAEKVFALESVDRSHPLSAPIAIARLKKYIGDDRYRVQLDDLVMQERNRVLRELGRSRYPVQKVTPTEEAIVQRLAQYEADTEILAALVVSGCYWGDEKHHRFWADSLRQIAARRGDPAGQTVWLHLEQYPAMLLAYAAGLACTIHEKYDTLRALLVDSRIVGMEPEPIPLALAMRQWSICAYRAFETAPGIKRYYASVSRHLKLALRGHFGEILPVEEDYLREFYRFEYLFSLLCTDLGEAGPPVGLFFHVELPGPERDIRRIVADEVDRCGSDWPPLKAGLFGGTRESFLEVVKEFVVRTASYARAW